MEIKGIKRGKTIELVEETNIADGEEIIFIVQKASSESNDEKLAKMKRFLETPREGRQEFVEVLKQLDRERR
jgi:hypothetical protein